MVKAGYLAAAMAVAFLGSFQLRANQAISFTSVNQNFTNDPWSIGWEFTTNVGINVTALGAYDSSLSNLLTFSSGLTANCGCGAVGIFDSAQNLLTSTTVLSTDSAIGDFRYHSISPLFLAAGGTYFIAEETGSSDYTWMTNGFTTDPAINFLEDRFTLSSTLVFPTNDDFLGTTDGFYGPNFQLSSTPEPSSLALFGTALAAGVAAVRMRRRKRAN